MNKQGKIGIAILLAICYFMFGMITYQLIKPDIDIQRDVTHMNCTAPDTSGDMIVCLILDGVIPLLIISIVSIAGGIITEQVIK